MISIKTHKCTTTPLYLTHFTEEDTTRQGKARQGKAREGRRRQDQETFLTYGSKHKESCKSYPSDKQLHYSGRLDKARQDVTRSEDKDQGKSKNYRRQTLKTDRTITPQDRNTRQEKRRRQEESDSLYKIRRKGQTR
jgi:hypothetical protein